MNLLETLARELKTKCVGYNRFTKAYYLYLRFCELFEYDYRFLYGDPLLVKEIYQTKIELEKITDYRVICSSIQEAYNELVRQLLDIKIEICGRDYSHKWSEMTWQNQTIPIDFFEHSDVSRVKMRNDTFGFGDPKNKKLHDKLTEISYEFGFIEKVVERDQIIKKAAYLKSNYKSQFSSDEYLLFQYDQIKGQLDRYPKIKGYYDMSYCIGYLKQYFLDKTEKRVQVYSLFDQQTPDMKVISIHKLWLPDPLYFTLQKGEDQFYFYKVPPSEASNLMKTYRIT